MITVRSGELIDKFIDSGEEYVVIDVDSTGRNKRSVYNGLLIYLKKHSDLEISVRQEKGDIILVNNGKHRNGNAIRRYTME